LKRSQRVLCKLGVSFQTISRISLLEMFFRMKKNVSKHTLQTHRLSIDLEQNFHNRVSELNSAPRLQSQGQTINTHTHRTPKAHTDR
jgi:hypothetical protein